MFAVTELNKPLNIICFLSTEQGINEKKKTLKRNSTTYKRTRQTKDSNLGPPQADMNPTSMLF